MKKQVLVNNAGIESAGLAHDYMEAICEYLWNGFDAGASRIDIGFSSNALDYIPHISITDNGCGIDLNTIESSFGNFMDSLKKHTFQKSSSTIRGNKGKGRFSFTAFSAEATWYTTFFDTRSDKFLDYDITIKKDHKEKYDYDNKVLSNKTVTGTTVRFKDLFGVTGYSFSSDDFKSYLGREFGWFLLLNKERNFEIFINEEPITYEKFIAETDYWLLPIKNADGETSNFKLTFIRWNEKIGDKFYFYFLNSKQTEVSKELTSFNNNAIGFNHSIYVESAYFDSFNPNDADASKNLFEGTKNDGVFKVLLNHLQKMVKEKQKEFINSIAANTLIESYERDGIIPIFKSNKYEQAKKKDLINVVKGIYCIEPKIFSGLNKEQKKTSIGLINILLDTDERNTILDLIGEIVSLSNEERESLLKILKKTTVAKITKTLNLIEQRFKVIELLKSLVFDLKKFTSEIRHLQVAIEENYWVFGEQYHLVSANESFTILYKKYLNFIEGLDTTDKKKRKQLKTEESNRRPDIFLCKKRTVPDNSDHLLMMEENVMVELKRPAVVIGKEQLRQIEDYLEIIRTDDAFNSQKRKWKFILVGNKVDDFVNGQYESQKEKGRKFLVKAVHNYEIYVYTWDDVFTMFNLSHQFLIDNLDFDKSVIKRELMEKGINLYDSEGPDAVLLETITVSAAS